MNKCWVFLISIVLLSVNNLIAQKQDFQSWWSAGFSGELFERIDFKVSPEIRITQNVSFVRSMHSDLDLSVPVTKFLRLGGRYRFQEKNYVGKNGYLVNRFGVYGQIDYKIHRLRLDYRALYQWEFVGIRTREYGNIPYQEHRHKISASYYRKKWDLRPQVSSELFLLRKPDFAHGQIKYRLSAGVKYKINKHYDIDFSYKYQNEIFEANPLQANIIAICFSYGL